VATVALLGTGRIGLPVARALAARGHRVRAHDVRAELAPAVRAAGAEWAPTPHEAAAGAATVFTVLPGSPELRALMLGAGEQRGLLALLEPDSIWIDLTSTAPDLGAELASAAAGRGVGYLDAPVGGGVEAAEQAELTLYVGGAGELLDRARPLLEAFAGRIRHTGPAGSGYLTKLLVNLLWFGQAVATTEAALLGLAAGLDPDLLLEAFGAGPSATAFLANHTADLRNGNRLPSFGIDRCVEELDSLERLATVTGTPFRLSSEVADAHRRALARYGPVDGELLAVAGLEAEAGMRLGRAVRESR
jgi:3-hydroxyisobutyrate dehydrogenase